MTAQRWARITEVFHAALERPAPGRGALLKEACGGDSVLRQEVERLLADQDSPSLASPAAELLNPIAAELAPGQMLAQYCVEAKLGQGGMGVVYRALDIRLNRRVAVKFLSDRVADQAARRRFQREAQTASSLNHPHIVTVHDVGELDGRQYLVTEFVDGGTLRQWMAQKGPWRATVGLMTGVADALACAHEAKILHRDIKPENILLTKSGYAKLADFGLAKLDEGSRAPMEFTVTIGTYPGAILGTPAYMSPEQATGALLDARSDIFSFGAVLYELLSGARPFGGSTDVDLLYAIVHANPAALTEEVPSSLRTLVGKALEKDPSDRYQSMREMVVDLRRLLKQESHRSGEAQSEPGSLPVAEAVESFSPQPVTLPARRRYLPAIAAAAGFIVIALGFYFTIRGRSPSRTPASIEDLQVIQLTSTGTAQAPAISPDGKFLAYVQMEDKDQSLWVRQIDTASGARIVAPMPGRVFLSPTFTPDGAFVEFSVSKKTVVQKEWWRAPFLGGNPKKMLESYVGPAMWSPDGRRVAFVRDAKTGLALALMVADPEYGHERRVPTGAPLRSAYLENRPAWSPGGNLVAILVGSATNMGKDGGSVCVVNVGTGEQRVLSLSLKNVDGLSTAWLDERNLVVTGSIETGAPAQLWVLSYPEGRLSRLTNDLSNYSVISLPADRRSLVSARSESRWSVWLADASGSRGMERALLSAGTGRPSISWSGDRLLYTTFANGHSSVAAISGGLAQDEIVTRGVFPAGTVDGTKIVVVSREEGNREGLRRVDADGRHGVQLVPGHVLWPVVTPDGRTVIFGSSRSQRQSLWTVPIDGGPPVELSKAFAFYPDVSRDGRQLVYGSSTTIRGELSICDLPDCTNVRPFVTPQGGAIARWTPDGKGIAYFEVGEGGNLWVQPLDGSARRQLTHFSDDRIIVDFAWSHDGRRLAIARGASTSDIVLFKGLRR